ncbi:hypothetical protein M5K25_004472 [Dendrobium thyrsiflorum]|uniref:Pentatricopeptide repeat-containing protein n=1 Tax=Dendrobium thyrsiflorum TaxID=117978 RepID=A0ABD0VMR6_DENTH
MVFRDVFTWSSMVDGYWKNGMVLEARQAFEAMPVKNVVSWTAMIQDMSGVKGQRPCGGFRGRYKVLGVVHEANVSLRIAQLRL